MDLDPHLEDQVFDWVEVKQHTSRESCWIVLEGRVYDVTDYLSEHPGGSNVLLENAGRDCTELFKAVHPWVNARKMLKKWYLGRISK
ncbi:cytochrome b5 [Nematocida homosporus]|uniref:cytochrome b5 n=1 Tax=Nematocida homosporus TaxID=1912981 RepID=UPI00221FBED0|nr:cytochrome b5 [Nematocida homosporus]KAI5184256.1 cytochrome b5 [Nematocida homosporus]